MGGGREQRGRTGRRRDLQIGVLGYAILGCVRDEVRAKEAQDAVPLWGVPKVLVDRLDRVHHAALGNRVPGVV